MRNMVLALLRLSVIMVFVASGIFGAQNIIIDGTSSGKINQGVGVVSAGADSRLLIDYAEPYRSQILDYLFKPNYGASLQMYKAEIGGDANSTCGAEPSTQHTSTTENYQAGYEGWIMSQAKTRNPAIKFAALPWCYPGWVQNWSSSKTTYMIKYIKGMESAYGITFDNIGGQNEGGGNDSWYISFKSALKSAGLSTKLVGYDDVGFWTAANSVVSNSAFRDAIDMVTAHVGDNGGSSYPGVTANAVTARDAYGKPLISSESHMNSGGDMTNAAKQVAFQLNTAYIGGKVTGVWLWPPIASCYDNVPYNNNGLIKCNQPWSGYYQVYNVLWVMAHTTQFIGVGWQFLDTGCKYFDNVTTDGNGSIVCAKNGTNWSAVVDMAWASAAQTLNFTIQGGLSADSVSVWSTKIAGDSSTWFTKGNTITPVNGKFSFTAQPGYMYSFTTTTGQAKGTASEAASAQLGLPYFDNFESYTAGQQAKYFSDWNGAFEVYNTGAGKCLRQSAPSAPVTWGSSGLPFTFMGSSKWADYIVSCDASMEVAPSIIIMGRIGANNSWPTGMLPCYMLKVVNTGSWYLYKATVNDTYNELKSGNISAPGTAWHNYKLSMNGSTISAIIDGVTVGSASDGTYTAGYAGLGTRDYSYAQFDNFSVTSLVTGVEKSTISSKSSEFIITRISSNAISFHAPEDNLYELIFYSSNGKVINKILKRSFKKGINYVQWNANAIAPGVYFIEIRTERTKADKIFVVN